MKTTCFKLSNDIYYATFKMLAEQVNFSNFFCNPLYIDKSIVNELDLIYVLDRSGHQTDLRSDIFSLVNLATTPYLCHLILIQKVAILRNHRAGMPGTDLPPKNLILTYYFVFPLTEQ